MRLKMKRMKAVALAGLAVGAMAFAAGSTELYIKAKNTKVMADPSPTANVVTTLQPGQKVIWLGKAGVANWHKVSIDGKEGVVLQSNLTKEKPTDEIVAAAGNKALDSKAFSNSSAATKALGDLAINYANGSQKAGMQQSINQLLALEALSKSVTPKEANAHAKKAGIFVVVGDKDQ